MNTWLDNLSSQLPSFQVLFLLATAFMHIILAGAIARDAGALQKRNQPLFLMSGFYWAGVTLISGIVAVAIYWLVHYYNRR